MSDMPYTSDTQRLPRAEIGGCALVQDLIPLYLLDEVTPESRVLINEHLQRCERCNGYLAGARSQRDQILHEQQALKNAVATNPTVTQVQQPVATSLGVALWQTLMVVLYVVGGFITLMSTNRYFIRSEFIVGGMLVVTAVCGLMLMGSVRTLIWRVLMLLTAMGSLFLVLIGAATPDGGRFVLLALGYLALAGWGLWLNFMLKPRQSATQFIGFSSQPSARGSLGSALLATIGALLCVMASVGGMMLLVVETQPTVRMIGTLLVAAAVSALLLINRRLGWISDLAAPHTTRRVIGYVLLLGGGFMGVFLVQNILTGAVPLGAGLGEVQLSLQLLIARIVASLPGALLGGLLVLSGLRLAQR